MMREYCTEQLRGFVDSGATLGDMAEEIGVSVGAVRRALRRRDMRATRAEHQRLRDKVQTMKPGEAIEYLLGCMEMLAGAMAGVDEHPVDKWPAQLTPSERRLVIGLHDANGATLTHAALLDYLSYDKGAYAPEPKILTVMVCKIRQKLPPEIARIETARGRGYRLVLA